MSDDKTTFAGQRLKIPPTEKGRARRLKIIKCAARLFEERGYANVTLADIVASSGGSLTTVYKWFGNKEELFLGVLSVHMNEVYERLRSAELTGATVEDDLSKIIETVANNAPFRLMRVALVESGVFARLRSNVLYAVEEKTNAPIKSLFCQLRKKHRLEFKLSDEEMTFLFVRYFRGLLLEQAVGGDGVRERMAQGERNLKDVLKSLIESSEGARA